MTNCKFASCYFCHFTSENTFLHPPIDTSNMMITNRDHLSSFCNLDNYHWYKNFFIRSEHLSSYNGSEFKVLPPLRDQFKTIFKETRHSTIREILICDGCIAKWREKKWLEDFVYFFHSDIGNPDFFAY